MPEAKHTPGPWLLAIDADGAGVRIHRDCEVIACVECAGMLDAIDVYAHGHDASVDPLPNARLIAAAPELLAACSLLLSELKFLMDGEACEHDAGICYCGVFTSMETAEAAIAKAKGAT